MIAGAAILPTAPLLVPGVSATFPDGVEQVAQAVAAARASLPPADVTVLLAAAAPDRQQQGVYDTTEADLAGVGCPQLRRELEVHRTGVEAVSRVSQYPLYRGEPLPLGLTVLALLHESAGAVVPVAVPPAAGFDALVAVGAGLAEALTHAGLRAVLLAAGDLSAGLDERAPLHVVPGATAFDERVVEIVQLGRLEGLARLGPEEARRVGALGWAPLVVLHGALARSRIGVAVRHYSAPRGVGYLVAAGT